MHFWDMLGIVLLPGVVGWASDGHNIISHITMSFLSPSGLRFWRSHLGDSLEDMVAASTWADSPDAERRYPQSPEYHFSHTPYRKCQAFDFKRDCGFNRSGNCLVSGIAGFVEYIVDPEVAKNIRTDALKFIIHFLGDIHQPLHTGFAKDAGGVKVPLTDPNMSLHDLWDYELINQLKVPLAKNPDGTWENVAEFIVKNLKKNQGYIDNINAPVESIDYFLDTDEARLEYASIIASETSMDSTCKHAYKDISGGWIPVNGTISQAYMESRGKIVIRQLSRAGIRLAHLLNIVSELFYERKEELRVESQAKETERKRSLSPTSAPKVRFYNSFGALALDLDFEPTEICEDEVSETSSATMSTVAGSPKQSSQPKSKKRKTGGKNRKVVKTTTTRAPEMEIEEKSLVVVTTTESPSMDAGTVDLKKVKLINRHGNLYVTSIDLVTDDYEPLLFDAFRVRFTRNVSPEPIVLSFDSAMFGRKQISKKMAIRAILQLKGISVRDEDLEEDDISSSDSALVSSSDIRSVERAGYTMPELAGGSQDSSGYMGVTAIWGNSQDARTRRQMNLHQIIMKRRTIRLKDAHKQGYLAQVAQVGPGKEFESLEKKWDVEFFTKLNKIAVFLAGRVQAFVHIDTLRNTTHHHMKFSEHNGVYRGQTFLMLIDTAIYDGDLTPRIKKGFEIASLRNADLSARYMRVRPTLSDELYDINTIFFDKDPNRLFKVKYVRNFFSYPGDDDESYHVFEWDLDSSKTSLFV